MKPLAQTKPRPFPGGAAKPRKFNNRPTIVDGIKFASQREANRYGHLKLLQGAGVIEDLKCHPVYVLTTGGVKIGKVIPDFQYRRDGVLVCEDVKSRPTITTIFKWKAKHLFAEHGVKIEVVF